MAKEYRRIEDIVNNSSDKAKLKNFIDEAVKCKQRQDFEKENIKAIKEEAVEQIAIDPKLFGSLVTITHKANYVEKQQEIHSLDNAIELVILSSSDASS